MLAIGPGAVSSPTSASIRTTGRGQAYVMADMVRLVSAALVEDIDKVSKHLKLF